MSQADLALDCYSLLPVAGVWLAVRRGGLPLLGASSFMAVGAYALALLGPGGASLPIGLAVLLAVLISAAAGLLIGAATARLQASAFALTAWASTWFVDALLRATPSWSGGAAGRTVPNPVGVRSPTLGLDVSLLPAAHLTIATLVGALVLLAARRYDSGPGAPRLAIQRTAPGLASTLGIDVARNRRIVMTLSAALCGLGGASTLLVQGVVTPSDVGPLVSIELFVIVAVIGGRWWAPALGAVIFALIDPLGSRLGDALSSDLGPALVVAALAVLAVALARRSDTRTLVGTDPPARASSEDPAATPQPEQGLLTASSISLNFGGIQALSNASITVSAGQIHGLIGPNGSGKSTLLKVLSGAHLPDSGDVALNARSILARSESSRVRAGVVRTPQPTFVDLDLDLSSQLRAAAGTRLAPAPGLRHLLAMGSSRSDLATIQDSYTYSLQAVGLASMASPPTSGDARLIQLARALATGASFLLLDEPAAGMTGAERAALAATLRTLAAGGHGILIVEHDLALVASIADTVTVMASGSVLASGTAAEMRSSPAVIAAYLGDTALA